MCGGKRWGGGGGGGGGVRGMAMRMKRKEAIRTPMFEDVKYNYSFAS